MTRSTLLASATAAAVGCFALLATADITGTAHDFSGTSWAGGEICKPCHAPHSASDIGYLWAHALSTQSYTLFDGSSSSPGGVDELDSHSRMCLSCHDGTVALNDFHGGGGVPVYIDEGAKLGTDLTNDHPIGITAEYPVEGSTRFRPATETPSGVWGFGGSGSRPEIPLFEFDGEQVVGCSTCHNPHGKTGVDHLLRKSNLGSALCLTCHIK